MNDNLNYIKKHLPFWDELTSEQQQMISVQTNHVTYSKGDIIYAPERECIGILMIKTGEIRTYILSEDGKEITLYRSTAGETCILSASCILNNITFDVHIECMKKTEALVINAAVFSEIASQNIHAELFSLRITADRFSDVMWAMEQILFRSLDERLATFLLDESARSKSDQLVITHEQIAKYIGSAREVITRMLKYFSSESIVELRRGEIIIRDKNKLKSLVMGY